MNRIKIETSKEELSQMNRKDAVKAWLNAGYLPLPVLPGQKATRTPHKAWLDQLSEQAVDVHWSTYPTDEIALHCSRGLVVLDADSEASLEAMLTLEDKHSLHPNLTVTTRKGVHHYFQQAPDLRIKLAGHSTEKYPERIDVRCGSGYIITAPSTDKVLASEKIIPASELVTLTQEFVDDLMAHNGEISTSQEKPRYEVVDADEFGESVSVSIKTARLRGMLEHLDPDVGYDDWLHVLMAIHNETDGADEGLDLADEWSQRGSGYKDFKEIAYKWNSFKKLSGSQVTMATICHMLKQQGLDPLEISAQVETELEPFEVTETPEVFRDEKSAQVCTSVGAVTLPLDQSGFPHPAERKGGTLPATFENFQHLMNGYGVEVGYDLIRKDVPIKIPHLVTTIDNAKNVKAAHVKSLCALNKFPVTHVGPHILALADLNAFNPVADWIQSNPWDGEDRLEEFRATLVEEDDYPADFKNLLVDKWMTSAVAAVFASNFRSRGVLTLSGEQGIGKTSWINSLVSDQKLRQEVVLTGHSLDANNRDSKSTALIKWITEFGEVETTLKHDLPAFKAFITNDIDTFRRPYAAEDSTMPRRTVFCASVNDRFFLKDPTGNSRFWVVRLRKINHQHGLDMQQVFAQYKTKYFDAGETWWLDSEQEKQLSLLNKDFEAISPIKELLTRLIEKGRAKGSDEIFMTATQLLQQIEINPGTYQVKEVHAAMGDLIGPSRKTGGNRGWDVPIDLSF